jgi:hypothetical protein
MLATVIAERIGWDRSDHAQDRIRHLRPAYLPADPASRTVSEPGEIAEFDLWFLPADIPPGFDRVGRPAATAEVRRDLPVWAHPAVCRSARWHVAG